MLQPIWAMIKPFGFAVLWIWHPGEVSALSGWFDAAFSLINSGCAFTSDAKSSVTRRSCMSVTPAASQVTAADMPEANRFVLHVMAAVAEQEGRAISERTKAALAAAKARGVKIGLVHTWAGFGLT